MTTPTSHSLCHAKWPQDGASRVGAVRIPRTTPRTPYRARGLESAATRRRSHGTSSVGAVSIPRVPSARRTGHADWMRGYTSPFAWHVIRRRGFHTAHSASHPTPVTRIGIRGYPCYTLRHRRYASLRNRMRDIPPTKDDRRIRTRLRRWIVPGATYFVTCCLRDRRPLFADDATIALVRSTLRAVRVRHPFRMHGYAFMPEHVHLLLTVEPKTTISAMMHSFQRNTTLHYKRASGIEKPVRLWQRGFWDHVIRDEGDFARHLDYIHYNPVKHGLVESAIAYPHTSLGIYVARGWYGDGWAQQEAPSMLGDAPFEP